MQETTRGVIPEGTQTLVNGIKILRVVAAGPCRLNDIVEATGLSRSTAHRLVQTWKATGFLRDETDGRLALGPSLMELGFRAEESISLQSIARPILLDLVQEVGDTIHLAVEENNTALYLDKIHGTRNVEIRSWPGCHMPLTYTGIGKALLLYAPERWESQFLEDRENAGRQPEHDFSDARTFVSAMKRYARQGFAYDLEENEPGIRCVAAPILDASGTVAGAISVSGIIPFMPTRRMKQLGPVVRAAADRISAELGYSTAERSEQS